MFVLMQDKMLVWLKIFLILPLSSLVHLSPVSDLKYGHFDLLVTKFEVCKGPKKKDCGNLMVDVKGNHILVINLLMKENMRPTKGKITVISKGKETIRLQLKNPCQHAFLKPLLFSLLNMKKDCLITKGKYDYDLDIQEVAKTYYGGEFLFGNWTFRSQFHNDDCNLSCAVLDVQIVPATEKHT